MDTLQLDLDVVLPGAHDARDRCVEVLVDTLCRLDGVDSVHVIDPDGAGPAKICLHLQPGAVSITRLEDRVRAAGAEIEERYGHLILETTSAGHAARARALTERLRSLPGVVDGAVTIDGSMRVEYDLGATTGERIVAQLPSIGIKPAVAVRRRDGDRVTEGHGHDHGAGRIELGAAGVSLVVYLVARTLDWFTDIDGAVTGLYVFAAALTGVFVARDALLSVRARVFDIDQLMLIAAVGASLLGQWSDAALLLVLFSLGHALEGHAMNRARYAIEALGHLAPPTARRREDPTVDVPIEDLVVGDIVVVRPDERLPVDGVIVAGETSIDESAVTGESVPVDKSPMADPSTAPSGIEFIPTAHRTFAGTLNGNGAIDVMALRSAEDSTLARVVDLVAEAETQISPTQRLTKRIVKVFVPAVLLLVGALLVVPPLLGEPFADSFERSMAVLVAASPCALAIATPSAVLAAIARAARGGILVKGGGPLEALGAVKAIAFDKTGTLTEGEPVLTDVIPTVPGGERDLLRIALSIEQASDHPIARAVTAGATARLGGDLVEQADDVTAANGQGITGELHGELVKIGSASFFADVELSPTVREVQEELESRGRTTVIVRQGECFVGVLGVMDSPRRQAKPAIEELRALGIDAVVMLSGDNQRVATAVGREVGIADARGGLLPSDKVDAVKRLALDGPVAMIGDGVNDAPALAAANVGIAMGAAGSDVALETADIALMADRIDRLPLAVGISRRAGRTIKQNLFFSLAVVSVLIPLTILGIGISVAVVAHEGSTLVVVTNALRLLNYRSADSTGPGSTSPHPPG